jgi:hypothetical protein
MRLLFCHILDPVNVGDRVCCPRPYFDWAPFETHEVDIRSELFTFDSANAIIFGGGGLLCEGQIAQVSRLLNHGKQLGIPVIGWGFGHNMIGMTAQSHPAFLSEFDLIAVRDRCGLRYCPCPSCLHPLFINRTDPEPVHERVYYSHHHRVLEAGDAPHLTNTRAPFEMEFILNFLASGRTVVTSTFHGAYWALLLGRRVIVPDCWSSRFLSLPGSHDGAPINTGPVPGYYEECVRLNLEFGADVKTLLKARYP